MGKYRENRSEADAPEPVEALDGPVELSMPKLSDMCLLHSDKWTGPRAGIIIKVHGEFGSHVDVAYFTQHGESSRPVEREIRVPWAIWKQNVLADSPAVTTAEPIV